MAIAPEKTVKDVVTDFLATTPSIEEIIAYRLPDNIQQRAHFLLEKNRGEGLTPAERAEMDEFSQIDHIMTLVKAKAELKRAG
ncbi:MAG: hypothetical protein GYB65_08845 [Chloroflexi bacterium]|nr:hypothetical protein [Chloroflexota bacterium]